MTLILTKTTGSTRRWMIVKLEPEGNLR